MEDKGEEDRHYKLCGSKNVECKSARLRLSFDTMYVEDGGGVKLDSLIQPRVEGEIAFVMEKDEWNWKRGRNL